jgi:hypothetical protein
VNTRGFTTVEPIIRWLGVALATLLSCPLHGCTKVSGGAVELSWYLQDTDGTTLGCDTTRDVSDTPKRQWTVHVESMRLWWQVDTDRSSVDFPCKASHDVTQFEVPTGDALLWIEPQITTTCLGGTPVVPAPFIAPAPIARTITDGNVVELHAVVVEIDVNGACTPSMLR